MIGNVRLRRLALGAVLLGLVLGVVCVGGCGRGGGDKADGPSAGSGRPGGGGRSKGRPPWMGGGDGESAEEVKTPVVVEQARLEDMEAFLDASSTLVAEEQVDVVSRATGVAVELHVEEGDAARRGDTLVRLDYEELQLAERAARSDLDKLKADYDRARKLADESLISEEEYQGLRFDYERAEIEWQQRKLDLEYTRIAAPISGTVTERLVNVGQLVQENSVVFRMVDFDSLVAPVFIPEKYLENLRPGQRAMVKPRGLGDAVFEGSILRISPIIDAQSGTIKVTVALDRRAGLRPGMFANVQIVLDTHENTVVLSKKALVFEDEAPHVFVVVDDAAVKRPLELGYQDSQRVEVVEGLEAGDTVVVVGQAALKDGSPVEIQGGQSGLPAVATPGAPGAGPAAPTARAAP